LKALLKQARQLGGQLESVGEELRRLRAKGSSGGGLVEVEVNGLQEVMTVKIDQSLVDQSDRELLEDLVCDAMNQAIARSRELNAEAMKNLAGGIEIPGLAEALAGTRGAPPS
jgi:hypothetical protein